MEAHPAVQRVFFDEDAGLRQKKGFAARPARSLSHLKKTLLLQNTTQQYNRVVGAIKEQEEQKHAHRKYRMADRISVAHHPCDLPLSPRKPMRMEDTKGFLSSTAHAPVLVQPTAKGDSSVGDEGEHRLLVYERRDQEPNRALTEIDPQWALQQLEEKFDGMEDISFSYVNQSKRVKLKPCLLDVIHCYDTFFLKMSKRSNFISKSKLIRLLTKEGLMADEATDLVNTFVSQSANPFAETIDFAGFMEQYVHYKIFLCIRALAQSFYHDDRDVTRAQLLECFEDQLGKRRAVLEVNSCFDLVDTDGNGTLDMEEIAVWYMTKEKEMEKAKRDREVAANRITRRSKLTDENITLSRVFEEFPDPSRLSPTQLSRLWREYEQESNVEGFLEDGTYHIFSQKYLDIIKDELIPITITLLQQFGMSEEVLQRAKYSLHKVIQDAPIDAISHDFDKYFQRYKVDDLKVSKKECMLGLSTALTENAAISELFLKIETILEQSFEWSYLASYIFEEQWVESEESANCLAEMLAILRETVEPDSLRLLWDKQAELDDTLSATDDGAEQQMRLREAQVHKVLLQFLGLLIDTVTPQLCAVLREYKVKEANVLAFEKDFQYTIGSLYETEGVLSRALVLDLRTCFSKGQSYSLESSNSFRTGEEKFLEKRKSIYVTPSSTEMAMSRLQREELTGLQRVEREMNEWEKVMKAEHADEQTKELEYQELRISLGQLLPLFDLRALGDPNCVKDMLSKLASQIRRVLKAAFDEGETLRLEEDEVLLLSPAQTLSHRHLTYQKKQNPKASKEQPSLKRTNKVVSMTVLQQRHLEEITKRS